MIFYVLVAFVAAIVIATGAEFATFAIRRRRGFKDESTDESWPKLSTVHGVS